MRMSCTKISNIVKNVFSPYEKETLQDWYSIMLYPETKAYLFWDIFWIYFTLSTRFSNSQELEFICCSPSRENYLLKYLGMYWKQPSSIRLTKWEISNLKHPIFLEKSILAKTITLLLAHWSRITCETNRIKLSHILQNRMLNNSKVLTVHRCIIEKNFLFWPCEDLRGKRL